MFAVPGELPEQDSPHYEAAGTRATIRKSIEYARTLSNSAPCPNEVMEVIMRLEARFECPHFD
jgi:hypothetical protein